MSIHIKNYRFDLFFDWPVKTQNTGLRLIIFQQELHKAFLDTQSEQKAPEGSRTTVAAVESCLQTLLEKKKPRLAQALAHFLQVESSVI